jgi:hypothetical protein
MSKEYKVSLLDWFGKIYRQTGSFKDQDGNVYLVFQGENCLEDGLARGKENSWQRAI